MDNLSSIIVVLILAVAVALVIRKMIKEKKAGKSITCSRNCGGCAGSCNCHSTSDKKSK